MKRLTGAILTAFLVITGASPSYATVDDQVFTDRADDGYNVPNYLEITDFTYGELAERPGVHYFHIGMNGPVPANAVNDGWGSWMAVFFDVNFDGLDDYRMEVKDWDLGTRAVTARVLYESDFSSVPGCTATAYVLPGAWYVSFTLDYECLKLPKTFRAQAYTAYDPNDYDGRDGAPDTGHTEFTHSFTNAIGARRALDKPSLTNEVAFRTAKPTQVNSKVLGTAENALVTVYCGEKVGSGFAVNAAIPANVTRDGFKSYILTTYSLIEPCIDSGKVRISTHEFENYTGYLSTWDAANDLAGFYIEKQLPTLSLRGETPAKNWWVVTTGSGVAYDDVAMAGRLKTKPLQGWNLSETTIRVTGFTYGAPVFDTSGRVLGLVSTVDNSGLATMVHSPAVCETVMSCGGNKVWISGLKTLPTPKVYANCAALNAVYPGGVAQSISNFNKGTKAKNQHFVSSTVFALNKKFDSDKDGIACEK